MSARRSPRSRERAGALAHICAAGVAAVGGLAVVLLAASAARADLGPERVGGSETLPRPGPQWTFYLDFSLGDFNGLPVISLPCGFTDGGLPIGFQIQGKPFAEAQVLQTAYAYEQAHPAIRERKCGLWK